MAVDYHGEFGSASVGSTQELELLGPMREMSWIAIRGQSPQRQAPERQA